MASFKSQYKKDIGATFLAYHDHDDAHYRMRSIHDSSRQKMCKSGPILWDFYFDQLWTIRESIPSDSIGFEYWFESQIKTLSQLIAEYRLNRYCASNFYSIGMAQKCLNLFLKDLWAFDMVNESQSCNFHAVIDRQVLSVLFKVPKQWRAWSKVIAQNEGEFTRLYSEYLRIQKCFINMQNHFSSEFSSVVELEQFIWHFVNNDCCHVVKDKLTKHLRVIPNA